jgi:VWFA-related protein
MLPAVQKMGALMHDLLVGQEGEVAMISFDHRVDLIQDFTRDPDKITAALATLSPGGQNSRLNDATQQAIRMLRNKKDRRRVILLISETLDRSSESRPREIATELQVHNIDVFTVNISRVVTSLTARPERPRPDHLPIGARPRPGIVPNDPTVINQIGGKQGQGGDLVPVIVELFRAAKGIFVDNPAELYTEFTGGREYTFVSQKDLERALAAIGEEIRSQYLLSYSPNNKMEGGFHNIEVRVKRPNLKVRTKPGYWMAAVPESQ